MYLADASIQGELCCIQDIYFICSCIPWIDLNIAIECSSGTLIKLVSQQFNSLWTLKKQLRVLHIQSN